MPFMICPHGRFPMLHDLSRYVSLFLASSQSYVVGLGLLLILLILTGQPVYAEWVLVSGDDEAGLKVYVDPATLRRNGNLAKMWQLYDYKTVQTVAGDSLLSMKRFNEYDCTEARTRMLGYTWFSGNKGNGNVVYSTMEQLPWEPIVPRTINGTLWKVACEKK
ncbi:MAG: surface-adhesin E family protein [Nitrospirota bacterium]